MKSLYQKTLESFTGTQELKEGDYVVCPMYPNEEKTVKNLRVPSEAYPLKVMLDGNTYSISVSGFHHINQKFPLFLKCSPPKKKVEKVFEGYVEESFTTEHPMYDRWVFCQSGGIKNPIKAKLIIEVEE